MGLVTRAYGRSHCHFEHYLRVYPREALLIYVIGALLLALALTGGYAKYEYTRAEGAEAKVETQKVKIESMNQASLATKADGDRRVAEASRGIARATKETALARTDAERLKGLQGSATPAVACPAGEAVSELRKGLK